MYLPAYHRLDDDDVMRSLVDTYPLGTWVCHDGGSLIVNHLPFHLDRTRGPNGTLIGHVARGNDIWRTLTSGMPSVVVFRGPQAYITPGWYPGKAADGKVVPTWNYMVVHIHGVARPIDDRAWLRDMLDHLTFQQESGRSAPWKVSDAPADYIDRMLRAIVGIEIPVDRMEGKLKVSQDEAAGDRIGTVAGLRQSADSEALRMADLVESALQRDGTRGSDEPAE